MKALDHLRVVSRARVTGIERSMELFVHGHYLIMGEKPVNNNTTSIIQRRQDCISSGAGAGSDCRFVRVVLL